MKHRMTVNQYTGHIALLLSCIFVGIVSNQSIIHAEFTQGIMNSLLQATLVYALLRLCASMYLIRYCIVLLIVITFFVQLTYHSTLTISIITNIINASHQNAISFGQQYLIEILITCGITLILALAPFPKSTLMSYNVSMIGLSYLLMPLLLQLPNVYQNNIYHDYLDKGKARGYSNSFSTIEYTLSELSPRLSLLSTLIAISDTINLYHMQATTNLSWTPTYYRDILPSPRLRYNTLLQTLDHNQNHCIFTFNDTTLNITNS